MPFQLPLAAFARAALLVAACLGSAAPASAAPAIPVYGYQVVATYPHDIGAFTEGLFYQDGFLYESTGLLGRSSVRKVQLRTGKVLSQVELPPDVFGEGITAWHERVIGVTWQNHIGFVLDLATLSLQSRFSYAGEGWGLTHNEREIVMSDGTAELRFLDPTTLQELRRVRVSANGEPVTQLNELEWVEGQIYANVWQTDRIARIDPGTGNVVGWIDLAGLLPAKERIANTTDVLNGIAYDAASKRLFVTGKLWPKLYEIRLVPGKPAAKH